MSRERRAQVLTGLLMAGVGLFLVARQRGWNTVPVRELAPVAQPKAEPSPQDALYGMLDAGREGRTGDYLGYFVGQMEASLKQSMAEQGEAEFARYLRETNTPIKGIAITEPQALTDREVKVRVEYVYQDRNEVQYFYLVRQGSEWKIARLDGAERIKTLVPYGTPVQ